MSHRKRSIPEDLGPRPNTKKRFSPAVEHFKGDKGDGGPEQNVDRGALAPVSSISSSTPSTPNSSHYYHMNEEIANTSSRVSSRHGENHDSSERFVCFGILLDGRMKLFKKATSLSWSKKLRSTQDDRAALELRFRHDCVTVLFGAHEEIGTLNKGMATALRSLKEIAPEIIYKVLASHEREQNNSSEELVVEVPLEIAVQGFDKHYQEVGSILSSARLFLQDPLVFDQEIAYHNPHILCWDESDTTSQLIIHRNDDSKAGYESKIEAVFESPSSIPITLHVEQDTRISTKLRSFKHMITGEMRSIKPPEARGGILSDEMGMGKSLTLIALIVHTLDIARSSERRYMRHVTALYGWEMEIKKTARRWCLTGTPVHNSLDDLFTLTEFLQFHPAENRRNAHRWILDPLKRREDSAIDNLRLLMKMMSLRRLRNSEMTHVRSDVEVTVDLSRSERDRYEMIRADAGSFKESMSKTTATHTLLSCILQMRQICSHGLQQRNSGFDSTKPQQAADICCNKCLEPINLASAFRSNIVGNGKPMYCQECGVEETSNISPTNLTSSMLGETYSKEDKPMLQANVDFMEAPNDDIVEMDWDATSAQNSGFPSKVNSVVANLIHLEREQNNDSTPIKSLVFSFWTTTLNALEDALVARNMTCTRIDGSLSLEQRKKAIAAFQSEPDVRIMLLSFGSGSVGLSLTAATRVHLVEPQWNPMVEAQAAARVDRLDQKKDVVILRYVVKDSIEKVLQELLNNQKTNVMAEHNCTAAQKALAREAFLVLCYTYRSCRTGCL
ncbi:MAG: hypothetical protein Q9167_004491 [Letrouitia subvulpina]